MSRKADLAVTCKLGDRRGDAAGGIAAHRPRAAAQVRYSGTEPALLRVMLEGQHEEQIRAWAHEIVDVVKQELEDSRTERFLPACPGMIRLFRVNAGQQSGDALRNLPRRADSGSRPRKRWMSASMPALTASRFILARTVVTSPRTTCARFRRRSRPGGRLSNTTSRATRGRSFSISSTRFGRIRVHVGAGCPG